MKWPKSAAPVTATAPPAPPDSAPEVPLAAILDSVAAAVLALDGQGRRLYANAAAERLFELVWRLAPGTPLPARVPELQRHPELVHWIETVNRDRRPLTERLDMNNGRLLDVYITPLAVAEGGCVIAARDVTEVVKLETARQDFIAGVSHELRTPLMSIQGYAEILRDQPELAPDSRGEFLDCILQSTRRLTRLAHDLVTLSSIETGTYPFHFTIFEAASLIVPTLALLAPMGSAQECDLVVEQSGPGAIRADADAVQRVLTNLIENAIVHGAAAARERGQRLRISVYGGASGAEYVFRISDNGPGISILDQQRIFERFYRVRRGGAEATGTGLGLALVKHIIQEHGGRVLLQSALGHGSTFIVRLPMAHAAGGGGISAEVQKEIV